LIELSDSTDWTNQLGYEQVIGPGTLVAFFSLLLHTRWFVIDSSVVKVSVRLSAARLNDLANRRSVCCQVWCEVMTTSSPGAKSTSSEVAMLDPRRPLPPTRHLDI